MYVYTMPLIIRPTIVPYLKRLSFTFYKNPMPYYLMYFSPYQPLKIYILIVQTVFQLVVYIVVIFYFFWVSYYTQVDPVYNIDVLTFFKFFFFLKIYDTSGS